LVRLRFAKRGDTTVLGVAGAFLATYLGQAVGWYQPGEAGGFIAAIVGALVLLGIYRLFRGGRRKSLSSVGGPPSWVCNHALT